MQNWLALLLLVFPLLALPAAPVDNTALSVWANEAIVATYTCNYQNFMERQKQIARYFTANGWIEYSKALNDSRIPQAIQANNYYVSAVATTPPEIKSIGDNKWQATMTALVLYKNPDYQQTQNLKVVINFISVPAGQGVRGLAITSLKAIEEAPPCKCPTTKPVPAPTPAPASS